LLSSYWAIAKNSFTEIVRQPVYGLLLLTGMTLIGLSPAITMFSMASDEALMVDMGLATVFLLGLIIAVLSATQIISREVESQTVGAILSKPVGRLLFILGKFTAVTMAMGLACGQLTVVMLLTLRIGVPSTAQWRLDLPAFLGLVGPLAIAVALGLYANFFYRWNFTSTAIKVGFPLYLVAFGLLMLVNAGWEMEFIPRIYAERSAWQVLRAGVLVFLGVWVLSSVALAISTRLNVVINTVICLTVFFVGMVSQYLFGRFADGSPPAWVALRIVPNLHVFWVGDQLTAEVPYIPMPYVWTAGLYALGFSGAMVSLAAFLFERREVT
jgi:hypothetical protein